MGNLYQGQGSVVSWREIKDFHFTPPPVDGRPGQLSYCWITWRRGGSERIDLRILEANCSGFTAMASALCVDNTRSGTTALNLIRQLATTLPFAVVAQNAERFVSQLRVYAPLLPDEEIYALLVAGIGAQEDAAEPLPGLEHI